MIPSYPCIYTDDEEEQVMTQMAMIIKRKIDANLPEEAKRKEKPVNKEEGQEREF